MSKAILVMDMPNKCNRCLLFDDEYDLCVPTGKDVSGETKPKCCPLREVPKKRRTKGKESENDQLCINAGWNACIDEILKEGVI